MRLDAFKGDCGWFTWHAEECRAVPACVWVDELTARFCHYVLPHRFGVDGVLERNVVQAKRIRIIPESRLVLVNPIDDVEIEAIAGAAGKPAPAQLLPSRV